MDRPHRLSVAHPLFHGPARRVPLYPCRRGCRARGAPPRRGRAVQRSTPSPPAARLPAPTRAPPAATTTCAAPQSLPCSWPSRSACPASSPGVQEGGPKQWPVRPRPRGFLLGVQVKQIPEPPVRDVNCFSLFMSATRMSVQVLREMDFRAQVRNDFYFIPCPPLRSMSFFCFIPCPFDHDY